MARRTVDTDSRSLTLIERKQHAARTRIIEAADDLFFERGFAAVSVTDIAERAEVGRTTFFRHFGDKTEVVFAKEQAMFDAIAVAASETWAVDQAVDTLHDALVALEPLVMRLCAQATVDLPAYRRHVLLVAAHDELRAREALKRRDIAMQLATVLTEHGASTETATVAAQMAVACYSSGRQLAPDPADLVARTGDAFRRVLAINLVPSPS